VHGPEKRKPVFGQDHAQEKLMMRRIGMLIFPRLTQLDMTGPYEVLARLPDTDVELIAHTREPVATDRGMQIVPTTSFAECAQLDVVMVPGGPGQQDLMEDEEVLGFLRRQAAGAKYVTSVCTGSLVLAAAGLLKGKRATSHWAAIENLALMGAVPVRERVVVDGNIVTGAGVASGIDFALKLAAILESEQVAREIQLQIEYDPDPPFDSGSPKSASPEIVAVLRSRLAKLGDERRAVARRVGAKLGIAPAADS
jgi:cyclohexyl-isocyanide hydratase